jgi:TrmH family RNA methyltransferase
MPISKAQIKEISALNRRKTREELGLFVAEGEKVVEELIHSNLEVISIWATEYGFEKRPEWSPKMELVSGNDMERMTHLNSPSPFLALARIPQTQKPFLHKILFLDRIQDPGNMGALIRIADWFGWSLVAQPGSVDFWNPKVVMASMGSIFRVQPQELTHEKLAKQLPSDTTWIGTDMRGLPLDQFPAPERLVLVMGSEAQGMSIEVENACKTIVTIPGGGSTESLNVSVAAGILCYGLTSQTPRSR